MTREQVEDKIQAMREQLWELEAEYEHDRDPELLDQIEELKYDIKHVCRTCGEPGEEMYDCHGIYAGIYCSEKCCPIRMDHYTQADVDEDIEPFEPEIW